jgi:hypothetical protein
MTLGLSPFLAGDGEIVNPSELDLRLLAKFDFDEGVISRTVLLPGVLLCWY